MKPLLLLDVDGVLLLQRKGHNRIRLTHGYIEREMMERVTELDRLFEIHWCTGWEHYANEVIAPLFGLDSKPVVKVSHKFDGDWTPRPFYQTADSDDHDAIMNQQANWKLAAVDEYLLLNHDLYRPVAWLDDQIGQTDVKRWAQARPNTKLVQTFEARGLQEREMRMLREFAYPHVTRFDSGRGLRGCPPS